MARRHRLNRVHARRLLQEFTMKRSSPRTRLIHASAASLVVMGTVIGLGAASTRVHNTRAIQDDPSLSVARDHWQANLDAIESIDVTFEVNAAKPSVTGNAKAVWERVRVRDEKVVIEQVLTFKASELADRQARRTFVYDGKKTTLINENSKSAIMESGAQDYARLADRLWFDAAMVCKPSNGSQSECANIVAYLGSSSTTMRPVPEVIDGVECWVTNDKHPLTGELARSIWMDPARGFLPMRQRLSDAGGKAFKEVGCTEAIEVFNGCWLPTKAWHRVIGVMAPDQDDMYEIAVVVEGTPRLIVNGPMLDAQLVAKIPSGYVVQDVPGKKSWIQP
jgi:hypothetical protein